MALIVALFLGLTVSAEEIFRDRKILKREGFLNLSRSSYLISKIAILFLISAIQAFLFTIIANTILGIKGMYFVYWMAMFSTAAFANILGLNISATFNSAVTIYILIPLVMIPMMILSGAMFSFDKLNRSISRIDKVPIIAELMVTKWTYEALMVHQYKDNQFMAYDKSRLKLYDLEKLESQSDYKKVYWLPELNERLERINRELNNIEMISVTTNDLTVIANEIRKESIANTEVPPFSELEKLSPESFNKITAKKVYDYLNSLDKYYGNKFQLVSTQKENYINFWMENNPDGYRLLRDNYHNEGISDIVRKVYEKNKILEFRQELVQHYDPIYQDPVPISPISIRTHFFSPVKPLLGKTFDTYWFNIAVVWVLTLLFYVILYYDGLKKLLNLSERFKKKNN
jgi:hypothetical protein